MKESSTTDFPSTPLEQLGFLLKGIGREVFWGTVGGFSGIVPLIFFGVALNELEKYRRKRQRLPLQRADHSHLLILWFCFFTVPCGAVVSSSAALWCQLRGYSLQERMITCAGTNAAFIALELVVIGLPNLIDIINKWNKKEI